MQKYLFILMVILIFISSVDGRSKDLGDLGTYVITPSKTKYSLMYLPLDTHRIYSSQIQRKNNLKEVLEDISSLQISERGYEGSVNTPRIRGLFSTHVLVMINNISINEPSSGIYDLSNITLENVDYIEIINGPTSSLYGGNAVSGVIKIFTKEAYQVDKPVTHLNLDLGSFGYENYYGSFNFKKGNNSLFLSGKRMFSDGLRENTELESLDLYSVYNKEISSRDKIIISGNYFRKKIGIPGPDRYFDYINYQWKEIPNSEEAFFLNALQTDKSIFFNAHYLSEDNLAFSIYFNKQEQTYNDMDTHPLLFIDTTQDTYTVNYLVGEKIEIKAGKFLNQEFIIGEEIVWRNFESKEKGEQQIYKKDYTISFVLQDKFSLEKLSNIITMRYDYNEAYKDKHQLSPSLSVIYEIDRSLRLFSHMGRAFTTPTFNDLYWSQIWMPGKPDLKPETSYGINIGFEKEFGDKLKIKLTGFYSDVKDLILWAPKKENPNIWTPSNIGKSYNKGVEIFLNHKISNTLSESISLTLLENKGRKSSSEAYKTLIYSPKEKVVYKVSYFTPLEVKIETIMKFCSSQWNINGWDFDGSSEKELPGYVVCDLNISRKLFQSEFFFKVKNLFDRNYRVLYEYPLEGRTFLIGIKLKFFD